MKGIHYLTDDNNERIAVQIDLVKYGNLWEDFYDCLIAEQRKDEETIPWENVKKALKDNGKLD
ncbi:MAG: hypothetical protein JXB49_33180 [Bacteroidales bacterium]|nr:hypothetical protein [Bacteroidales bacterium]